MQRTFTPRDVANTPTAQTVGRHAWILREPNGRRELFATPEAAMRDAPEAVVWAKQPDGTWRGQHRGVGTYQLEQREIHE